MNPLKAEIFVDAALKNWKVFLESPGGIDHAQKFILSLAVKDHLSKRLDNKFDPETNVSGDWQIRR